MLMLMLYSSFPCCLCVSVLTGKGSDFVMLVVFVTVAGPVSWMRFGGSSDQCLVPPESGWPQCTHQRQCFVKPIFADPSHSLAPLLNPGT